MLIAAAGPEPTGRVRLGITASRKVGNAVVRNRIKRATREWFRTGRERIVLEPGGLDLVVIARRAAAECNPVQIAQKLDSLITRYAKSRA